MATEQEIKSVEKDLFEASPVDFIKMLKDGNAGIGAALKFLYVRGGTVSAGEIAEFTGVSTARVAVLLKKMEKKGLIIKCKNAADGRITDVKLSDGGLSFARKMQEHIEEGIAEIIDGLGMEKVKEFISISREIKRIMENNFSTKPQI